MGERGRCVLVQLLHTPTKFEQIRFQVSRAPTPCCETVGALMRTERSDLENGQMARVKIVGMEAPRWQGGTSTLVTELEKIFERFRNRGAQKGGRPEGAGRGPRGGGDRPQRPERPERKKKEQPRKKKVDA